MPFLSDGEREVLEAFARLANGNPFLADRVGAEAAALGDAFVRSGAVWHVEADLDGLNPNVARLAERAEAMAAGLRDRLARGERASDRELALYQTLAFYLLYQRYEGAWRELIGKGLEGAAATRPGAEWRRFARDVELHLALPDRRFPEPTDPAFLFALGFQIRRAFHHIFRQHLGGSLPAAGCAPRSGSRSSRTTCARYRRALYARMGDVPTLVAAPSGTGKELVARAIGALALHAVRRRARRLHGGLRGSFRGLNLSALSPTLIESELFGHRRGAFTGALEDREGWLEGAGPLGTVFLDEIGELDPAIQVKLLRVLQTRTLPAPRRDARAALRGQDHRRHEPRPRAEMRGGPLPRGPLLPPLRRPDPHADAARAARRLARASCRNLVRSSSPRRAGRATRRRERARRRGRALVVARELGPRLPPGPATSASSSSACATC